MKLIRQTPQAMLMLVAALFSFCAKTAVAQNEVQAESLPSTTTVVTGSTVTVDINIDLSQTSPSQLLGSFSGTLKWDTAVLSFVNHSGVKAGFTGVVGTANTNSGELSFNGANVTGAGGEVNVLTITFTATGTNGTSTALDLEFSAMSAALTFTDLLPLLSVTDGAVTVNGATHVDDDRAASGIPATFALRQNYPNPFNPETVFTYELPHETHVGISIFNITGRRVATLIEGRMKAGIHVVSWNGLGDSGRSMPSGVYFCRMVADGSTFLRRMTLIK